MVSHLDYEMNFITDTKLASSTGGQEWGGVVSFFTAQHLLVLPWSRMNCVIFSFPPVRVKGKEKWKYLYAVRSPGSAH